MARATQVTQLSVVHRDGQSFLTWRCPQIGTGWTYRVHAGFHPFTGSGDFADSTLVAVVGDSSWCDRRLSSVRGQMFGFAPDSGGPALDATQGLCVVTAAADRPAYYAVTAQVGGETEDRRVSPGANALVSPVMESVALPRPVFQRTLVVNGSTAQIYTLWTSTRATPLFPAMANRTGMAFDCAVVRGWPAPDNPLMIVPHHAGGDFLEVIGGSGHPGEWVLTLDDPLPNTKNTFWYGYHEDFDVTTDQWPIPTTGTIQDYTYRRVLYTVLWARRNFPVDTTRVFAMGGSMGGIGSLELGFRRPDLLAGIYAVVPKFNFGFLDDPNPLNEFNTGGGFRTQVDRTWGTVATNLPSSDGHRVYESLDDGFMAGLRRVDGMPPIIAFNGRYDTVVGWAEKIGFYTAMETNRLGGYFFWDRRDHIGLTATLDPMQQPQYLYRWRTNLSYPALSNCTADLDPGNGDAALGDSIGTINGFLEWGTDLVDLPDRWEVSLTRRNLYTRWGGIVAPDPITVSVTPRRLQQFTIAPGATYTYRVTRLSDQVDVGTGSAVADGSGLLTVSGVTVTGAGVRLRIEPASLPGAVTRPAGAGSGARGAPGGPR